MNIALFDFDGTITKKDTYTAFLFFATSTPRKLIGVALLWPFLLLYKCSFFPGRRLRTMTTFVAFSGVSYKALGAKAKDFSASYIPKVLRPTTIKRFAEHKDKGDRVIIVSAGLDIYLKHWAEEQGAELICTELAREGDRLTGLNVNGDCGGNNKVVLIKTKIDIAQYQLIYAYGDTKEDLAMLALASHPFYRGMEWRRTKID